MSHSLALGAVIFAVVLFFFGWCAVAASCFTRWVIDGRSAWWVVAGGAWMALGIALLITGLEAAR